MNPADPQGVVLADDIRKALYEVIDPELGINIVDLGLVYDARREPNGTVVVDMTLTSAACPLAPFVEHEVRKALQGLGDEAVINWVWMPPWGPQRITTEGRDQLRALGFNI